MPLPPNLITGRTARLPGDWNRQAETEKPKRQRSMFAVERFASEIAEPALVLVLPWPPSVNHYWRHVVRGKFAQVYISAEGKAYRSAVAVCVRAAGIAGPLAGKLSVELLATMPDMRTRDLDNLPKALLDALTHAGVYGDDSQIDRLVVARAGVASPGSVEVRIAILE